MSEVKRKGTEKVIINHPPKPIKPVADGTPAHYEPFHHHLQLDISALDRAKIAIGGKVELSLCGRIVVHENESGKYHYLKFHELIPKAVIWLTTPPNMVEAHSRFADTENLDNKEKTKNDGDKAQGS